MQRRNRCAGLVTAGVALLMVAAAAPAMGGYEKPPRAVLRNNLGHQRGPTPTSSGGRPANGGFCEAWISDGFADWPKALKHKRHRKLHLRFRKNRKPSELEIDEEGGPRNIPYNLKPVRNDAGETVGWDARFRRAKLGHHRLWVDVFWQGDHDCRYDEATYQFHVKTID